MLTLLGTREKRRAPRCDPQASSALGVATAHVDFVAPGAAAAARSRLVNNAGDPPPERLSPAQTADLIAFLQRR